MRYICVVFINKCDMTTKEFEDRTGLKPTEEEFSYIHSVYMHTSMDKDAFCRDFKKHGTSETMKDLHANVVNYELKIRQLQQWLDEAAAQMLVKACVYEDTDLYKTAVDLVGQKKVIMKKIELVLPLWDEDKEYIKNNIR